MSIKFYKEIEYTINQWWGSLPDEVQKALLEVYDKYEKKENENERRK
jgi:TRAP-type C4-dicarboxylate transport system substrate-binding protein|tara:strand:+ start:144 stop:284 length:141 start_codon:yes stop_codon:yes gene_type:complete